VLQEFYAHLLRQTAENQPNELSFRVYLKAIAEMERVVLADLLDYKTFVSQKTYDTFQKDLSLKYTEQEAHACDLVFKSKQAPFKVKPSCALRKKRLNSEKKAVL